MSWCSELLSPITGNEIAQPYCDISNNSYAQAAFSLALHPVTFSMLGATAAYALQTPSARKIRAVATSLNSIIGFSAINSIFSNKRFSPSELLPIVGMNAAIQIALYWTGSKPSTTRTTEQANSRLEDDIPEETTPPAAGVIPSQKADSDSEGDIPEDTTPSANGVNPSQETDSASDDDIPEEQKKADSNDDEDSVQAAPYPHSENEKFATECEVEHVSENPVTLSEIDPEAPKASEEKPPIVATLNKHMTYVQPKAESLPFYILTETESFTSELIPPPDPHPSIVKLTKIHSIFQSYANEAKQLAQSQWNYQQVVNFTKKLQPYIGPEIGPLTNLLKELITDKLTPEEKTHQYEQLLQTIDQLIMLAKKTRYADECLLANVCSKGYENGLNAMSIASAFTESFKKQMQSAQFTKEQIETLGNKLTELKSSLKVKSHDTY